MTNEPTTNPLPTYDPEVPGQESTQDSTPSSSAERTLAEVAASKTRAGIQADENNQSASSGRVAETFLEPNLDFCFEVEEPNELTPTMKLEAALKLIEQYRETIAKLSGQIPEPKPETNAAYVSPEQKQKELEKRHRDSCPDGANCSCFDADRGIPRSHRKRKTFIDQ